MTVPAQNVAPQAVAAAGQTVFNFAWRCDDSALVVVFVNNVQDGGFTVFRNPDQTATPGGTITRGAPCVGGEVVTVERLSPQTQTVALTRYGPFPADTITAMVDKFIMLSQEAASILGKTVKAARASLSKWKSLEMPSPEDGKMIACVVDPLNPNLFTLGLATSASIEFMQAYIQQVLSGGGVVQPLKWVFLGDDVNTDYNIAGALLSSPDLYLVTVSGATQEPTTDYTIDITVNPAKIKFTAIVPLNVRVAVRSLGYAKGFNPADNSQVTASGSTTARPLKDWMVSPIKAEAFGSKGDGVTDDVPGIVAAIASLPAAGGVVDCRGLRSPKFSTTLTIAKAGVSVLLPGGDIEMGANQIVVPVGVHNVALIGTAPWGSGAAATAIGTYIVYTGAGVAVAVGDSTADTHGFVLQDVTIRIGGAGGAATGLQLNRVTMYHLVRPRVQGLIAVSTQKLIDLKGFTNYTGGVIDAPHLDNGNIGIHFDKNANGNTIIGGFVALPPGTGAIGLKFLGGVGGGSNGNFVLGTDVENADTAIYFDQAYDNQLQLRVEGITTFVNATANSQANRVLGSGSNGFAITDLGVNNAFTDTYAAQFARERWQLKNTRDLASSVILQAGTTAAQRVSILLRGHDGNDKYEIAKSNGDDFTIVHSATAKGRLTLLAGNTVIDAEGAGAVKLNTTQGTGGTQFGDGAAGAPANISSKGGLSLGTPAGVAQTGRIWQGSGVPNNADGANGDIYFRTDTPGTVNQRMYMKSAGAWVALAI